MGSLADPGEFGDSTQPSFEEFQRQTSLMTSCTLLWKELSDHFSSLEQDLKNKYEALNRKFETLDSQTHHSLQILEKREFAIDGSISIALEKVDERREAALVAFEDKCVEEEEEEAEAEAEVDNDEGLLLKLRSYCMKMDSNGFWRFVSVRKKELESIRALIVIALADCVDPARFVLEAISEVFPVDKRVEERERVIDLGWACVLVLESLIPVVVDPVFGQLLVTPTVKGRAEKIAETWKASLDERGGIENVKTPDVHTFLQHLVSFGIVKKEDVELYRKLVVGSAWRKQMPKLAVSLGLGDSMPDMIEELISRGQQVDAVHFTHEVGLVDKFPPVPLLKAFLKNAKKAADNSGRAANLAARKEQSALRAVIKCIEEYKLEAQFPPENLKKRLEQLEKTKIDKKRPAAAPANKRTRANNGGPMPPAKKAGRLTNAYVSSFPTNAYARSPSHNQYPAGVPPYPTGPTMYGSQSPPSYPYAYSPESYTASPIGYPAYAGYGNGMAPAYQHAYYR